MWHFLIRFVTITIIVVFSRIMGPGIHQKIASSHWFAGWINITMVVDRRDMLVMVLMILMVLMVLMILMVVMGVVGCG